MSSHYQSSESPEKMAIPRLIAPKPSGAGSNESPSSRRDRPRTDLACVNCRRRKVKCSGGLPKCEYCIRLDISCKYPPPRRDKLHMATIQLEEALALLRELKVRQNAADQESIQNILNASQAEDKIWVSQTSHSNKRPRISPVTEEPPSVERGESKITGQVGSNESLDVIEEDLIRDAKSRATGFIGKCSVIQWIRRLKLQIDLDEKGLTAQIPHTFGPPGVDAVSSAARVTAGRLRRSTYVAEAQESISQSTYFVDDESVDIYVEDPFNLPPSHLAEHLFSCYMVTVHPSFPILSKKEIELDFNSIFSEEAKQDRNSFKMLAILNLVFAIGAKFSYLVWADFYVGEDEHLRYSTKARKLGITESTFVSHPDLERVRILGLLSFYLFSIGQVSRASNTMGLTVRLAFTLGLHVRNEDPVADVRIKEARVRVWWSLYSLERLFCSISGRPSAIADSDCSIFLPVPLEEDQMDGDDGMVVLQQWFDEHSIGHANTELTSTAAPKSLYSPTSQPNFSSPFAGVFFRAMVQASIITHKAVKSLYSTSTVTKSWEDTQNSMKLLKNELDAWAKNLPKPFTADPFQVGAEFQHETRTLTLMYWSAVILITRPCVCRLDIRIEDQTAQSDHFNQYAASLCVTAAKKIASLFPNHIDPTFPYKDGPWWFVVHNMMQAITIFLLELYHRTHHVPGVGEKKDILLHLQKLVEWLKAMGKNDPLAYRAYRLVVAVIRTLGPQIKMSVASMLGVENDEEAADAAEDTFQGLITSMDPPGYTQDGLEHLQFNTPFAHSPYTSPLFGSMSPLFDVQAQFMDPRNLDQDFGPMFNDLGEQLETSGVGAGTQAPSNNFDMFGSVDGTTGSSGIDEEAQVHFNESGHVFGGWDGAAGVSDGIQEPPSDIKDYPGFLFQGN